VESVPSRTQVEERVVLVDEQGNAIGELAKSAVHHARTPLHLAFSLYLFDTQGRLLMTRRALSKVTWPGVWTNSCCGHPMPGESMTDAVTRRVAQETGLRITGLREVLPDFAYRVQDVSGIWENEICPVFTATVDAAGPAIAPDPDEVMDWTWVDRVDIARSMARTPFAFSPWAVLQMEQLAAGGAAFGGVHEGAR
jgi:isopentenyl-diphosphate delta-isomerase type 1